MLSNRSMWCTKEYLFSRVFWPAAPGPRPPFRSRASTASILATTIAARPPPGILSQRCGTLLHYERCKPSQYHNLWPPLRDSWLPPSPWAFPAYFRPGHRTDNCRCQKRNHKKVAPLLISHGPETAQIQNQITVRIQRYHLAVRQSQGHSQGSGGAHSQADRSKNGRPSSQFLPVGSRATDGGYDAESPCRPWMQKPL